MLGDGFLSTQNPRGNAIPLGIKSGPFQGRGLTFLEQILSLDCSSTCEPPLCPSNSGENRGKKYTIITLKLKTHLCLFTFITLFLVTYVCHPPPWLCQFPVQEVCWKDNQGKKSRENKKKREEENMGINTKICICCKHPYFYVLQKGMLIL